MPVLTTITRSFNHNSHVLSRVKNKMKKKIKLRAINVIRKKQKKTNKTSKQGN